MVAPLGTKLQHRSARPHRSSCVVWISWVWRGWGIKCVPTHLKGRRDESKGVLSWSLQLSRPGRGPASSRRCIPGTTKCQGDAGA